MTRCIYCWDELPVQTDVPAWHDRCEFLFSEGPSGFFPAEVEAILSAHEALENRVERKLVTPLSDTEREMPQRD